MIADAYTTPTRAYNEQRRRDAFSQSREAAMRRKRRVRATDLRRGIDSQGRFIGPNDIERACAHFWSAPHRRGAAPIVRHPDLTFPKACRSLLRSGLDFGKLREIWRRYAGGKGESKSALARAVGCTRGALNFHLRNGGSASMRAAIATHETVSRSAAEVLTP